MKQNFRDSLVVKKYDENLPFGQILRDIKKALVYTSAFKNNVIILL